MNFHPMFMRATGITSNEELEQPVVDAAQHQPLLVGLKGCISAGYSHNGPSQVIALPTKNRNTITAAFDYAAAAPLTKEGTDASLKEKERVEAVIRIDLDLTPVIPSLYATGADDFVRRPLSWCNIYINRSFSVKSSCRVLLSQFFDTSTASRLSDRLALNTAKVDGMQWDGDAIAEQLLRLNLHYFTLVPGSSYPACTTAWSTSEGTLLAKYSCVYMSMPSLWQLRFTPIPRCACEAFIKFDDESRSVDATPCLPTTTCSTTAHGTSRKKASIETFNPGNGKIITRVAQAGASDVDTAVQSAHEAFQGWSSTPSSQRAAYLRKAADVLLQHAEELAMVDALNTGNPVAEMLSDAKVAAANLEYFAGLIPMLKGETIPQTDDTFHYTVREPLGVVARIVAFNHPVMFAGAKIAAPLAAGNTVIVKPPDQAPLSCMRLAELLGPIFPPGVLNILPGGAECGKALSIHPLVKMVTLIGSVPTGKAIQRAAADFLKPTLLELGGKNALVAYPDADLDKLVNGITRGMNFTWAGQSCGSTSRVFLHESHHDVVLERVVALVQQQYKPGVPTYMSTTMGPVISKAAQERILSFIESAKAEGARLALGGQKLDLNSDDNRDIKNGFFIPPTIFADVAPHMRIAREEIFGPVMAVFKWSDEASMLQQVNSTPYGLTASVYTSDTGTAHRAVRQIEAGIEVTRIIPFADISSSTLWHLSLFPGGVISDLEDLERLRDRLVRSSGNAIMMERAARDAFEGFRISIKCENIDNSNDVDGPKNGRNSNDDNDDISDCSNYDYRLCFIDHDRLPPKSLYGCDQRLLPFGLWERGRGRKRHHQENNNPEVDVPPCPLPNPDFLRIHMALARTLHASGVGELIDQILREREM
ncbi:hypothetical protein VTN00DRAFT_1719 [Thermoascus crustaceus]|uniref:uncharacterized protein n=1 Tax=Thermoascus crustaceus TaxID=5088 RepID=UPI00374303D9